MAKCIDCNKKVCFCVLIKMVCARSVNLKDVSRSG